jgi:hypothetical protein
MARRLVLCLTFLQIIRSLADPPTSTVAPSSAASACLWEVLAYALCKSSMSQQDGERLFSEAAAAIAWAVEHKPLNSSAAVSASFQTFSATFGSFWKWIGAGACPLSPAYCAALLQVSSHIRSIHSHRSAGAAALAR